MRGSGLRMDGLPSLPALAQLSLERTGLEDLASLPSLSTVTKLRLINPGPENPSPRRLDPLEAAKPPSRVKSLADLTVLPNLREISLNDQLIDTIPELARLEKIEIYGQAKDLFPLARFKSTLRELSIFSEEISDWNSIAMLSNL
jgi:hypothetical protein